MKKIGLIAYSWALSNNEPNRCNRRLAKEVYRIAKKFERQGAQVVVVAQWEIAKALPQSLELDLHIVSSHRKKDAYLNSEEVTNQASVIFKQYKVTEVVPVAQPFLHIAKCRKLVKRAGFKMLREQITWIGFYRESLQWWTRGPLNIVLYAILQIFGFNKGRHIKTP